VVSAAVLRGAAVTSAVTIATAFATTSIATATVESAIALATATIAPAAFRAAVALATAIACRSFAIYASFANVAATSVSATIPAQATDFVATLGTTIAKVTFASLAATALAEVATSAATAASTHAAATATADASADFSATLTGTATATAISAGVGQRRCRLLEWLQRDGRHLLVVRHARSLLPCGVGQLALAMRSRLARVC